MRARIAQRRYKRALARFASFGCLPLEADGAGAFMLIQEYSCCKLLTVTNTHFDHQHSTQKHDKVR